MKNVKFLLLILLIAVFGCNNDNIFDEEIPSDSNLETASATEMNCLTVNLIAGQYYNAGSVNIEMIGDNIVITYSADEGWTIKATHLSIGNCEEGSIPTTNSGNPQIGRFEYQTSHPDGTNEVIHTISKDRIEQDMYCVAAHAEVIGPNGEETAWGEGLDFGGSSWAMYIKGNLSDCENNDNGEGDVS